MAEVEILGSPFSNYVRSVRMALAEKGVAYKLVDAFAHSPEIDAIHPLGKIPVLRHGDFAICESTAIATYIDLAFHGPELFPDEPKAAAVCAQWVSILNTAMIQSFQTYMIAYYFPQTPDGQPDKAAATAAMPKVESNMRILDGQVAATGFLAGDHFTYADIALIPVLYYLAGLPESGAVLKALPALTAYLETHSQRPSFAATTPPSFEEFREIIRARMAARAAAEAKN